jgi:predicted nucleic acid-binding protein
MSERCFLDTNVLLYASLQPDHRSDAARALLGRRCRISVQVLDEFANVARRKLRRGWPEIARALVAIRWLCAPPLPLALATHEAAIAIAERFGYGLSDATAALQGSLHDCCSPRTCTTAK